MASCHACGFDADKHPCYTHTKLQICMWSVCSLASVPFPYLSRSLQGCTAALLCQIIKLYVYIFLQLEEFQQLSPLKHPRYFSAVVVLNNFVFVVGGQTAMAGDGTHATNTAFRYVPQLLGRAFLSFFRLLKLFVWQSPKDQTRFCWELFCPLFLTKSAGRHFLIWGPSQFCCGGWKTPHFHVVHLPWKFSHSKSR